MPLPTADFVQTGLKIAGAGVVAPESIGAGHDGEVLPQALDDLQRTLSDDVTPARFLAACGRAAGPAPRCIVRDRCSCGSGGTRECGAACVTPVTACPARADENHKLRLAGAETQVAGIRGAGLTFDSRFVRKP